MRVRVWHRPRVHYRPSEVLRCVLHATLALSTGPPVFESDIFPLAFTQKPCFELPAE